MAPRHHLLLALGAGIGDLFDYKNRKVEPTFNVDDLVIIDSTGSVEKEIGGIVYTVLDFNNVLMVVAFTDECVVNN